MVPSGGFLKLPVECFRCEATVMLYVAMLSSGRVT